MLHEKTKNFVTSQHKFDFTKSEIFYDFFLQFWLFFREERTWVSGKLDGTSKYYYASGSVETRIYENGILQGMAVKQTPDGECEDR